jgi:hypothetical protein
LVLVSFDQQQKKTLLGIIPGELKTNRPSYFSRQNKQDNNGIFQ